MRRILIVVGALSFVACRGETSQQPQIIPIRNMHTQPRYDPQEDSPYFADGRTMRPPVEESLSREAEIDEAIDTGVETDGSYVMLIPQDVIQGAGGMGPLLERGHERFGIYCVPCHGGIGDGHGMVPRVAIRNDSRAAPLQPPTFHDDRLRHSPDGQIYATIRNGIRNMPSYRANIPVRDRWAIVAYVRALQLSQMDQRTAMNTPNGAEATR